MTAEKVLLVDDEPSALEGYRRLLHRDFEIETTVSPREALSFVNRKGPYSVVVSDMRMPEMDGAELLTRIRAVAPETVRIAITGYTDIETAAQAINAGRIFRFLTKPCEKETLRATIKAGVEQYRLLRSEKELLEGTLSGSVKVLAEMLSLTNPAAFSRAKRVSDCVKYLVHSLGLALPWSVEVASMLSQLGCATLDPELMEAYYAGKKISDSDQATIDQHPLVAAKLLGNIPRMEPVAWMIAHMNTPVTSLAAATPKPLPEAVLGAKLLGIAAAYDRLIARGSTHIQAIQKLAQQDQHYESSMVSKLEGMPPLERSGSEPREVNVSDLVVGMILHEEVRTHSGLLVVAKGQEITPTLLIRLRNFEERKNIASKILVLTAALGAVPAHA